MTVFQIKISLKNISPPIWRRLLVSDQIQLPDLHKIIQSAMGWTNTHLHGFSKGFVFYVLPDEFFGEPDIDYRKVKISELLKNKQNKFTYTYDYGDNWEHHITLEKIEEVNPDISYPVCIAGKRSCPPENCGGEYGYEQLLHVLSNKRHKDYREATEWVGEDFNPESFDMNSVNAKLQQKNFGCPSI